MSGMALQYICTSFNIKLTGNRPGCGCQLTDTGTGELWKPSRSEGKTKQWTWTVASTSPLSGIHSWMRPDYCTHHDLSNFYPPWCHFTHHHQDVMPLVYKQHLACILLAFQLKHPGLFDLVLRILLKKLTRLLVKRSWSMGVSNISGWKVIARVAHLGAMPSWHYVHHQHVHSVSPRVLNNSWN